MTVPEVHLDLAVAETVAACAADGECLATIEADVLGSGPLHSRAAKSFRGSQSFIRAMDLWRTYDYVILRDVPPSDDGLTGLLLAASMFHPLRTYRGRQIVKHFRMSPWTTALSHTLAEGHFHTDINTAESPPAVTIMQCLRPDPSAPNHGQLRVARLADLLEAVRRSGHSRAWQILSEDRVVMVNGSSMDSWSGHITDGKAIRFHPDTLRLAQRRYGNNPLDLEECLGIIHESALSVSYPIDLREGELLIVSNRRTLHQRSSCTVRFSRFPREFESRAVAVLHGVEDPP